MCVCVCACVKICVFLSTSIRTGIAGMASMGALGSNTLGKPQARTWANALFSAVTINCVRSETQPCTVICVCVCVSRVGWQFFRLLVSFDCYTPGSKQQT